MGGVTITDATWTLERKKSTTNTKHTTRCETQKVSDFWKSTCTIFAILGTHVDSRNVPFVGRNDKKMSKNCQRVWPRGKIRKIREKMLFLFFKSNFPKQQQSVCVPPSWQTEVSRSLTCGRDPKFGAFSPSCKGAFLAHFEGKIFFWQQGFP